MAKRWLGPYPAALTRLHRIPARRDRPSGSTVQARHGPRGGLVGGRPGNWMSLVGALALVGVALAGCSSTTAVAPSTTSAPTSTTSASPTASTTSPSAATDAVLAAYRAGWAAYEQALSTSDPSNPALATAMVNPVLEQVRKSLIADNLGGVVGKGATTLHPRVASLTTTTAVIYDCTYSTSILVYKATGKPVPPVTKPEDDGVRTTLVFRGGIWKVSRQTVTEGSCPAGY